MQKRKGNIAITIAALAFAFAFVGIGFWAFSAKTTQDATTMMVNKQAFDVTGTGTGTGTDFGYRCPATTISGHAAFKNPENASNYFTAGTIVYTDASNNVKITDTATSVSGTTTVSYKSTTIPCDATSYSGDMYLYAVASSTLNSGKSGILRFNGANDLPSTIVDQSVSSGLVGGILDGTYTNTSQQTDGASAYAAGTTGSSRPNETAATAMSSGDSRSGYVDIWAASGNTEFGGPKSAGIVISIDTVDSQAFNDKDISLSCPGVGLSEVYVADPLYSKTASVRSANRMYTMPALKSSAGYIRCSWTMKNGGGSNAGATSDPIIYFDDMQYFVDTDQVVRYGAFDAANTNIGQAGTSVLLNNS